VLYLVGVVLILGPVDAPVVLLLLVICLVVLVDWTGLRIIYVFLLVLLDVLKEEG
jgi:hypothetical protein